MTAKAAGRKRRKELSKFPKYVVELRMTLGSQHDAADKLGLSQSVLAKYETGKIGDPHPSFLHALALATQRKYLEVIATLVQERYSPPKGWDDEEALKWELIKRIIAQPEKPEDVQPKEALASRLAEFDLGQVLDVPAIAQWQTKERFRNLTDFWVVAPSYLGPVNKDIFKTVQHNIRKGVTYTYFIFASMLDGFRSYKKELAIGLKWTNAKINERLRAWALPAASDEPFTQKFFGTAYMIANPAEKEDAVAYQCIRQGGRTRLALKLDKDNTGELVSLVTRFTTAKRLDV